MTDRDGPRKPRMGGRGHTGACTCKTCEFKRRLLGRACPFPRMSEVETLDPDAGDFLDKWGY